MVTIQIQDSVAELLTKSAEAHGLSLEAYVEYLVQHYSDDDDIESLGPTNAELKKLASHLRPSQEWYDE